MASSQASEKSLEVHGVRAYHFGMPGETCERVVADEQLSLSFLLAEYSLSTGLLALPSALLPVVCATLYPSALGWHPLLSEAALGRGACSHELPLKAAGNVLAREPPSFSQADKSLHEGLEFLLTLLSNHKVGRP